MEEQNKRCCICLTLRVGSALVGFSLCFVDLILLILYIEVFQKSQEMAKEVSGCFYSFTILHFVLNCTLIVSAWKKNPSLTLPWLAGNLLGCLFSVALIFAIVFRGFVPQDLFQPALATLCVLAPLLMFCWIVVFQFRLYLKEEQRRSEMVHLPTAPFDEARPLNCVHQESLKSSHTDSPPSYEEAIQRTLRI